ncbi:hypothetical protein BH23CHL2_BH23CHL2_07530 [soil metagenome]
MSPRAAALLEHFGFEDVRDYVPGKVDWFSRGLPLEGKEVDKMDAGILAMDPPLLNPEMSPEEAVRLIDQREGRCGAVVDRAGVVVGLLTRETADKASTETVESAMELGPKTYRADEDPAEALDYMERHDLEQVVVSGPDGKLIGLLYRDVVAREVRGES